MASPIIIDSSSPNSLRLPSITPPSQRNSIANATSSSPGLPSPSAFAKPKVPALKSGSRAQAFPANAGSGFATAGSLWRENRLQNDAVQDAYRQETTVEPVVGKTIKKPRLTEREGVQKEVAGKLKKPAKTARQQTEPTAKSTSSTLHPQDFAGRDSTVRPKHAPAKTSPPKVAMQLPKPAACSRKPSVDSSEYTFGVYDLGMQTQAPTALSAAKKPRKKATTSKESKAKSSTVDKPRKRKAKSEAIILNSDGPVQEDDDDEGEAAISAAMLHTRQEWTGRRKAFEARPVASRAQQDGGVGPATDKGIAPQGHMPAVQRPVYFTGAPTAGVAVDTDGSAAVSELLKQPVETEHVAVEHVSEDFAAPRRTGWTPVKDTGAAHRDGPSRATGSPPMSVSPTPQLTDILGDFGYVDENAKRPPIERTTTKEAVTKRHRIELADATTAGPAHPKANATTARAFGIVKETKKPAGRKKLQTITGLATAAYQAPVEQPGEQSTVSESFAPRKENTASVLKEVALTTAEKLKKPRKPRKKKGDAVDGEVLTLPPKRTKKAKLKFDETNYLTKLYSPLRATEQMQQQDFLFGTSSQLAVDESPAFIRDMQAAVQASEMDAVRPQLQTGSQSQSSKVTQSQLLTTPRRNKSCVSVPTAPHGTCLSLGQAQRELWCVSSRDDDGGFLREPLETSVDRGRRPGILKDKEPVVQPSIDIERTAKEAGMPPDGQTTEPLSRNGARFTSEEANGFQIQTCHDAEVVVDLCDASPVVNADNAEDSAIAFDEDELPAKLPFPDALQPQSDIATKHHVEHPQTDDSCFVISSDGPEPDVDRGRPLDDQLPASKLGSRPLRNLLGTRKLPSPIRYRSVLQPVNANASIIPLPSLRDVSPIQARAVSNDGSPSEAKSKSTIGKPRGRPRKDVSAVFRTAPSPKKRGRPPKRPIIASDPSPEAAKFKRPKATISASQPLQSPSDFLDVDEISDSDSPVTPSPPRRRASPSPPAVPALDIANNGSPLAKLKEKSPVVVSAPSNFKPGEPQWPSIREQIFPQISVTVRDALRSTDASKPSWYQKILMYDPITLEDLTAWLNEEGLRIQVRKQKPKAKKRGRKKRDADGKAVVEESMVEWEVHDEQLQPWMVQKWCEERSICCVWAGGGWGGRGRH